MRLDDIRRVCVDEVGTAPAFTVSCMHAIHVTTLSLSKLRSCGEGPTSPLINVTISSDMLLYRDGRPIIIRHLSLSPLCLTLHSRLVLPT